jgi:hypothetical protein
MNFKELFYFSIFYYFFSTLKAPGVQVIQSNPIEHYSQTYINGTKKGSAKKKIIVEEIEEGDGETEEEVEETIITTKKKTVKKKKGSKTYVRLKNFHHFLSFLLSKK